ncbi:hypothetical protein [Vibrio sp. 10N.237.312.B06]
MTRVWLVLVLLCRAAASFNKAIKVMRYTRRFWYEVWCAFDLHHQYWTLR